MGWNDHVNWELLEAFEYLADKGHLDHLDKDELYDACEAVAYGTETPEDARMVRALLDPLLAQIEDLRREDYLDHLMSKDD